MNYDLLRPYGVQIYILAKVYEAVEVNSEATHYLRGCSEALGRLAVSHSLRLSMFSFHLGYRGI